MSIVGKSYLISLIKGRSDLLRIPEELARDLKDLGIRNFITCICCKPDGCQLPVRINVEDRTIIELGPFLRELKDEDIRSVRLEGKSNNPLRFAVAFSKESAPLGGNNELPKIHRPAQGLYLGGKLKATFHELVRTGEPVMVNESDLLQHAFVCGATGSGKTVLAKIFIEEAALKGIPVIAIDLKGDISSMGVVFSGEDATEIIPWVEPRKDENKESVAANIAEKHKTELQRWGLNDKDVNDFKTQVAVNVFTPRSNAGFRLALSAFVEPPDNFERMKQEDPDSFESIIGFMTETFVSRLTLTKKKADKARGYIHEIIKGLWTRGEGLRGYNGIKQVLDEVRSGHLGIEQIGGMATNEYISQKDREEISSAINRLLIGAQKLWFQGFPLNIEELIEPNNYDGKTPVTIINLKCLSDFQDQAYVVGYIAYLIWFWMKQLKGVDRPRLIFYIDEIGGGGSKEAFFPSVAISPSKPALNLLLRQGRAFGVCCIFATQNPGDIDYKALGQCATWAVGQLRTDRDLQKIKQGAGAAELEFETASQFIPTLSPGQFVIRTPSFSWMVIEERWLMHLHRVLSFEELERLKEVYEKNVATLFEKAQQCIKERQLDIAKRILKSIISGYRFSMYCAKAYLQLGKVLYAMSDYDNTVKILEDMIKHRLEAEEIGEAYFLLGKCREQQDRFDEAMREFSKVANSGASEDIKRMAVNHEQYCKTRIAWPQLSAFEKFSCWIIGRKPDNASLIKLQSEDKELLEKSFTTLLQERDFSLPEPIDFSLLIEASKKAAAEQREKTSKRAEAERRAAEKVPKIEALLKEGTLQALQEAETTCKRIIQELQDADASTPASVIEVFEKYNKLCEKKESLEGPKKKILLMEARQFEFEIANLFRCKGYESLTTSLTRDDGVDVFASNESERVIIQCKRWNRPVGRDKVDELAGVRDRHSPTRAILATTSTFSDDAKRAARENNIELWDFERLKREWIDIFRATPN